MLEGGSGTWQTWVERRETPTAPSGYKGKTAVPSWVRLGAIVRCPELDSGRGLGGFTSEASLYVVERIRADRRGWLMVRLQRMTPPFYVNGKEVGLGHLALARLPKEFTMSAEANEATRYTRGDGVVEEPKQIRFRIAEPETEGGA